MLMLDTNTYPRLAGIFDLLDCMFQERCVQPGSIGAGLAEKIPNPVLVRIEYCSRCRGIMVFGSRFITASSGASSCRPMARIRLRLLVVVGDSAVSLAVIHVDVFTDGQGVDPAVEAVTRRGETLHDLDPAMVAVQVDNRRVGVRGDV